MTITFEQLETEVRRLATEQPDYIYPANANGGKIPSRINPGDTTPCPPCVYTQHQDKPPCIFGQALLNLGVPAEQLHDQYTSIRGLLGVLGIEATRDQYLWASAVQESQDAMTPWGLAIGSDGRARSWG
jgi:hypothetical protein